MSTITTEHTCSFCNQLGPLTKTLSKLRMTICYKILH